MPIGDEVLADGEVYIVRFDGRQSLLSSSISYPSPLADLCRDPHRRRHRGRGRTPILGFQTQTYAKAKREYEQLEARLRDR